MSSQARTREEGEAPTFTSDRVQEVNATKGSCDAGIHLIASSGKPHLRSATDLGEYVALSELDQGKLKVIAVRQEVCGGPRGCGQHSRGGSCEMVLTGFGLVTHLPSNVDRFP